MKFEKFNAGDKVKFKSVRKVPGFIICTVKGYNEEGKVLTEWADDGTITREHEHHLILHERGNAE